MSVNGTGESDLVVLLAGPTACGKSRLAMDLAKRLDGVVINADSMQVYRELAILTARPGPAEEAVVPHALYGFLPAARACSAALWRDHARDRIAAAHRAGRLPILVGGSGLYFRALTRGLAPTPAVPAGFRARAEALYAKRGGAAFRRTLADRDPVTAARLDDGDRQRLVRAWEVIEATGTTLSDWHAKPPDRPLPNPVLKVLLWPARDALYAACDARFDAMIEAGALEEVAGLDALDLPESLPAMKALGVPALRRHLRGAMSLDEARTIAKRATRHFAKRQCTWFRHQFAADLQIDPGEGGDLAGIIAAAAALPIALANKPG